MRRILAATALAIGLATAPVVAQAQPQSIACIADEVCSGEPLTLQGTFESYQGPGVGFALATEDESVLIRGLGPRWWWRDQGVQRPRRGDALTVDAVSIDCCGESFYVALSMTLADETVVQLRDPTSGLPAWRGAPVIQESDDIQPSGEEQESDDAT